MGTAIATAPFPLLWLAAVDAVLAAFVVRALEAAEAPEPVAAVTPPAPLLLTWLAKLVPPVGVAVARKEFPLETAVDAILAPLSVMPETKDSALETALDAMLGPTLVTLSTKELALWVTLFIKEFALRTASDAIGFVGRF